MLANINRLLLATRLFQVEVAFRSDEHRILRTANNLFASPPLHRFGGTVAVTAGRAQANVLCTPSVFFAFPSQRKLYFFINVFSSMLHVCVSLHRVPGPQYRVQG